MKSKVEEWDSTGPFWKRALKLVVSGLVFLGDYVSRSLHRIIGEDVPGTCVVLCYHALPTHHRANFANQMDLLVRAAKPVKSQMSVPLQNGVRYVAIVFHDAFQSVYDNAVPELIKRGIYFTLFVPSGSLGKRQGWIDDETYSDYREQVVSIDCLRLLDSEIASIGSHTVSHPDLLKLSESEALEELRQSKLTLEGIIGRPVKLLAFPYGRYNKSLIELCKQIGYERVFTIEPDLAFLRLGEYVTGSCPVSATDWNLEFRLKLLGAYRWLPRAYRLKRRIVLGMQAWRAKSNTEPLAVSAVGEPVLKLRYNRLPGEHALRKETHE